MKLHEYQSKEILGKYGVKSHRFIVGDSIESISKKVDEKGWNEGVVKAQIHAGGRGKVGGVKLARSRDEIVRYAKEMLGKGFITRQTSNMSLLCNKVMVSEIGDIEREIYLGLVLNRENALLLVMASNEGGIDIEEVAEKSPEKIMKAEFDQEGHCSGASDITKFLDVESEKASLINSLCRLFIDLDLTTLEINPLAVDKKGALWAIDAKMIVDDNALFRQGDLAKMNDPSQIEPREAKAASLGLAYVSMKGNIGCMVNGAGLAMATMDLIEIYGGKPANFLDVGGDATEEKVKASLELISEDKSCSVILINIFGGIVKCDLVARGCVNAIRALNIKIPLVVRLEGTNVEEGRELLSSSDLDLFVVDDLDGAAKKAVEIS